MTHRTTQIVVLGAIAVLSVYDLYAIASKKPSISKVVLGWADDAPMVAFLFGLLMGHLFWPQR